MEHDPTSAELLAAARRGDRGAWETLTDRYTGLLWSIALRHGLRSEDAADLVQVVWLRLLQHLDRIHDPERLTSWLATTARRESWRVSKRRSREVPVDERVESEPESDPGPELRLVCEDSAERLRLAIESLPGRPRLLLQMLLADPAPSYQQVAVALDMPVGSIGPTRARAFDQLRRSPLLQAEAASRN